MVDKRISTHNKITVSVAELMQIGVLAQELIETDSINKMYYEGILDSLAILLSDFFGLTPTVRNKDLYHKIVGYQLENKIEQLFKGTEL